MDPEKARFARLAEQAIPWLEARVPSLRERAVKGLRDTTDHIDLLAARAEVLALERILEDAKRDVQAGKNNG